MSKYLYIYDSHLSGYYCTLEELEDTICETCWDSDFLIDRIERQEVLDSSSLLQVLIVNASENITHAVIENDTKYLNTLFSYLADEAKDMYESYKSQLVKETGAGQ